MHEPECRWCTIQQELAFQWFLLCGAKRTVVVIYGRFYFLEDIIFALIACYREIRL